MKEFKKAEDNDILAKMEVAETKNGQDVAKISSSTAESSSEVR